MTSQVTIRQVSTPEDLTHAKQIVEEYIKTIPYDISFQDIEKELQDMPGKYVPQKGGLFLIAHFKNQPAGCVAYRKMDDIYCEMKRLYVRPAFRNNSIGSLLITRLLDEAKHHYKYMRLDSIAQFKEATKLYQKLGFKTTENYNQNPLPSAVFYQKQL